MNAAFFGTPEFAVPVLTALSQTPGVAISLVVSRPDRPVGRKQILTPPPVAIEAREHGLPLAQPAIVRGNAPFLELLRRAAPDVIVVVAYGKILPPEILAIPPLGGVNVHASLLPRFRGASPVQAAILAGDSETGISIMRMTEGLDEGPVYRTERQPIHPADTGATLTHRLAQSGARLLVESLPLIARGQVAAKPQEGEPVYCRVIRKEDGRIDWNRNADEIARRRRAYTPWPGIFTFLDGERIRILEAEAGGEEHCGAQPGTIRPEPDGRFVVVAGAATSLRPLHLQREGKTPVTAGEFFRGLSAGQRRFG